jgi:beta-lactamase regulating signal transducer with metallopeptidase domain
MAIVNWLVQGSIVAALTAVILRVLFDARARSRYLVCWVALVAVLALPVAAFLQIVVAPSAAFAFEVAAPHPMAAVVIGVLTAIGAAGCALWSSVRGWQFAAALTALRRTKRECQAFPGGLENRLHYWSQLKNRGRRARLMLSADVRAAAVLGGRHAIIAVSPALIDHLSAEEVDRLVVHEWAHVQRRDDTTNVLQILCAVFVGWHPAVWWLNRRLHEEREAACDEMAATLTRSGRAYAASLVKAATLPLAGVTPPLPAVGVLSSPSLTARVRRIVSRRRFGSRRSTRNAFMSSVFLLAVAWLAVPALKLVEAAAISGFEPPAAVLPSRAATLFERSGVSGNSAVASTSRALAHARQSAQPATSPLAASDSSGEQREQDRHAVAEPPLSTSNKESAAQAPLPAIVALVVIEPSGIDAHAGDASAGAPQQPALETTSVPPWTAATAAGRAIGQGSKNAGVATAGFFTRLSKRIAGSF